MRTNYLSKIFVFSVSFTSDNNVSENVILRTNYMNECRVKIIMSCTSSH